ncbi:MAG TPA: four helix bundle protein [Candidatus Paceibacterota bacterium]|jgi:four helix bundle protein|nr:four helix bundle protein [Candidatus Paceibacterota bacterium]HJO89893.1 four helix bundle protein [Candidatus Paceibacterota bacterium]|tara:strand:- start:169 stop:561 length:393 start_codon:yes stop_codon:yes gene_type:complete
MNNKTINSYKELTVWQKSVKLVVEIYLLTEKFPREEIYGLTSQMRRASVSIPSNIAEGRMRGSRKDFIQFLRIAYSSGAELETQTEIAKQLPKTKVLDYTQVDLFLDEVMRMLHVMIKKLNPNEANEAKS